MQAHSQLWFHWPELMAALRQTKENSVKFQPEVIQTFTLKSPSQRRQQQQHSDQIKLMRSFDSQPNPELAECSFDSFSISHGSDTEVTPSKPTQDELQLYSKINPFKLKQEMMIPPVSPRSSEKNPLFH